MLLAGRLLDELQEYVEFIGSLAWGFKACQKELRTSLLCIESTIRTLSSFGHLS